MKRILELLISLSLSSPAGQLEERRAGMQKELLKYHFHGEALSENYRATLMAWVEQDLKLQEQQLQDLKSSCEVKMEIYFLENKNAQTPEIIRQFEKGMVRIDITLCFDQTTPKTVLDLANNNDFQTENISTLRSVTTRDQLTCHKTKVSSVGESHYCFSSENKSSEGFASTMTYNVWNDDVQNYNAPVYFRQILLAAKQLPQGQVAFRSVTYLRGPDLNGFQRMFSRGVITSEQTAIYEKMKGRLNSSYAPMFGSN